MKKGFSVRNMIFFRQKTSCVAQIQTFETLDLLPF